MTGRGARASLRRRQAPAAALVAVLALAAAPAAAQRSVERAVPDPALTNQRVLPFETISAFAETTFTFEKDTRRGGLSKDTLRQTTVGFDLGLTPSVTLSGGLTHMSVDRTLRIPAGEDSTDGLTGYVNAGFALFEVWTLQVSAGYGTADVDQTRFDAALPLSLSHDYTSVSRFVGATMSGTYYVGDLLVQPFSQIVYAETRYPTIPDVVLPIRGYLDTVGRAGVGAEVAYPFVFDTVLVAPVLRGALLYDVNLPTGYTDRTAFEVAGGLNILTGRLTAGARLSATLGREDYLNRGVRAFLSYRF